MQIMTTYRRPVPSYNGCRITLLNMYGKMSDIVHISHLTEADGKIDLVVLKSPGQWRTLPPPLRTVHSVLRLVTLTRLARVAVVAQLTLNDLEFSDHIFFVWVGAGQFAVELWFRHSDTAGRRRLDFATDSQVEIWRRQSLCVTRLDRVDNEQ